MIRPRKPPPEPVDVEQWRSLAIANGRTWDPDEVLHVAACESSGRPDAIGIGGRGLMGVAGGPLDPEQSMAWAYHMWEQWRWSRWASKCRP